MAFAGGSLGIVVIVVSALSATFLKASGPPSCRASDYVSSSSYAPGFFPACFFRVDNGSIRVTGFVDGMEGSTFEIYASSSDWRGKLEEDLNLESLPELPSPPNKYEWRLFTRVGDSLEDLDNALDETTVFIFKGGTFIWPGVFVGHEHRVQVDKAGMDVTLKTLSLQPLAFEASGFLSTAEMAYILEEAGPHVVKSSVSLMDHDKGKDDTEFRTSSTYFMATNADATLVSIDERVSWLTRQAKENFEDVQVLRYEPGQSYDAHHDYFDPKWYASDAGVMRMIDNGRRNRLVTVFWYLSEVEEGGETAFPKAVIDDSNANEGIRPVEIKTCTSVPLKVPPEPGKVLVFYSLLPNGQFDDLSLHTGCPVIKGVKWAVRVIAWLPHIFWVDEFLISALFFLPNPHLSLQANKW